MTTKVLWALISIYDKSVSKFLNWYNWLESGIKLIRGDNKITFV